MCVNLVSVALCCYITSYRYKYVFFSVLISVESSDLK